MVRIAQYFGDGSTGTFTLPAALAAGNILAVKVDNAFVELASQTSTTFTISPAPANNSDIDAYEVDDVAPAKSVVTSKLNGTIIPTNPFTYVDIPFVQANFGKHSGGTSWTPIADSIVINRYCKLSEHLLLWEFFYAQASGDIVGSIDQLKIDNLPFASTQTFGGFMIGARDSSMVFMQFDAAPHNNRLIISGISEAFNAMAALGWQVFVSI